ncbi:MAG: Response regulator MprA [Candidatus Heimdallarchaeota archaeon LC_3]|nr:MAG: Response regulator MprA [Candidatus Heimdallarchaeota archaeon LC_3]
MNTTLEKKIKILHIDDEENFLEITNLFFKKKEKRFIHVPCNESTKAIQMISQQTFDVVVCDYEMPHLNGLQLLEQLRKKGNFIPFIIFTGRGREEIAIKALNQGADFYVNKGTDIISQYKELCHFVKLAVEKERMKRALTESELRFRHIFQKTPFAQYIRNHSEIKKELDAIEPENRIETIKTTTFQQKITSKWKTVEVNDVLVKMLGFKNKDDFIANFTSQILNQKGIIANYVNDVLIPMLNGETFVTSHYSLEIKGEQRWFESTVSIADPEWSEVFIHVNDITDLVKRETALKRSEEEYRRLVKNLPVGVTRMNLDGIIKFAHLDFERSTLKAEDVIGKSVFTLAHSTHKEKLKSMFNRVIKEKKTIREEIFTFNDSWTDLRLIPIIKDGEIIEIMSIHEIITQEKEAREALKNSETKYQTLVENLPVVSWKSTIDGKTTFISSNVEQIYGYTPEEIINAGEELWFGRIHPDDKENVIKHYQSIFNSEKIFDVEYRIKRKDGHWIWIHDKAIRVFEENNKVVAYGVFEDITDIRKSEKKYIRTL